MCPSSPLLDTLARVGWLGIHTKWTEVAVGTLSLDAVVLCTWRESQGMSLLSSSSSTAGPSSVRAAKFGVAGGEGAPCVCSSSLP